VSLKLSSFDVLVSKSSLGHCNKATLPTGALRWTAQIIRSPSAAIGLTTLAALCGTVWREPLLDFVYDQSISDGGDILGAGEQQHVRHCMSNCTSGTACPIACPIARQALHVQLHSRMAPASKYLIWCSSWIHIQWHGWSKYQFLLACICLPFHHTHINTWQAKKQGISVNGNT